MHEGDKVRFVGDAQGYTAEGQRILRRTGEIMQTISSPYIRLKSGLEVRVRWIPKTKRGYSEVFTHKISDLELIE
jgi:hypothetical protein